VKTPTFVDVSHLSPTALDARAPAWWGNTLLLAIETTTVVLLAVSYLYLWRNYPQSQWPPPRVEKSPALLDPVPDLLVSSLNTLLLLASSILMIWTDRTARQQFADAEATSPTESAQPGTTVRPIPQTGKIVVALLGVAVLGSIAFVLRIYEFPGLKVSWSDNAYASLVWSILGLHLTYILIGVIELALSALWLTLYSADMDLLLDVTLTATYWYWTVGVWVVLYGLVYWFPRVA
jgi:cytochrome c oxidase subunit III